MPSTRRAAAAMIQPIGERRYRPSSRLLLMLVARIRASHESDERVLELASRVVELQEIELGLGDRAADVGPHVLAGRQREREAAALLVRLADLGDVRDRREHLRDRALR